MNKEEISIEDTIKRFKLKEKAPTIKWGADFEDKSDKEKIVFLKKFADSFNHALDIMQKERNQLFQKCTHLENQIKSLNSVVNSQKAMVQKTITDQNEIKTAYQNKIILLENKIKSLNGD